VTRLCRARVLDHQLDAPAAIADELEPSVERDAVRERRPPSSPPVITRRAPARPPVDAHGPVAASNHPTSTVSIERR